MLCSVREGEDNAAVVVLRFCTIYIKGRFSVYEGFDIGVEERIFNSVVVLCANADDGSGSCDSK